MKIKVWPVENISQSWLGEMPGQLYVSLGIAYVNASLVGRQNLKLAW